MRVIFTGCTSIQVNSQNRSISKIDVPASIVEALRSYGHEVDWRKVEPGEDLSQYDVAWVNLAPINSLNGRSGAMGALETLSSGLPCVGFFDDWQVSTVFNGMNAVVRRPLMLYKHMLVGAEHRGVEKATYFDGAEAWAAYNRLLEADPTLKGKIYVERYYFRDTDEAVRPHAERYVALAKAFINERWARGMVPVCPMYSWGDRSLVAKIFRKPTRAPSMGPIEALDPSSTIYPLIAPHEPLPPEEKKRAWILGALMPHDDWIERNEWEWPIEYLGSKSVIRKHGGERVKTESDVIDRYNQHWGILSPPYMHSGSGWWRSRFMYAAKVGSVLVCGKGEGDPLGSAYKYSHKHVEAMSTEDLAAVARAQAEALRPHMPPPELFASHCDAIIRRAHREDKGWTFK